MFLAREQIRQKAVFIVYLLKYKKTGIIIMKSYNHNFRGILPGEKSEQKKQVQYQQELAQDLMYIIKTNYVRHNFHVLWSVSGN